MKRVYTKRGKFQQYAYIALAVSILTFVVSGFTNPNILFFGLLSAIVAFTVMYHANQFSKEIPFIFFDERKEIALHFSKIDNVELSNLAKTYGCAENDKDKQVSFITDFVMKNFGHQSTVSATTEVKPVEVKQEEKVEQKEVYEFTISDYAREITKGDEVNVLFSGKEGEIHGMKASRQDELFFNGKMQIEEIGDGYVDETECSFVIKLSKV